MVGGVAGGDRFLVAATNPPAYAGDMSDITRLIDAAAAGDPSAAAELLPLVYDELRKLAAARMAAEQPGQTLQATALVHEAYVRLVGGGKSSEWNGRAHFFAAAAEAMRRILIEHARSRGRIKRGGRADGAPRRRIALSVVDLAAESNPEEILSVDEAVRRLESQDNRLGQIVRLRFYAGLPNETVAQLLGLSERTVRRDWELARAFLMRVFDDR